MPKNTRKPNVLAYALVGIVVLAIAAVVIGVAAGGDDDDDAGGDAIEESDVEVSGGENLVPFTGTGPDPAVGLPAPILTGQTFAGDAITVPGDGPALVVFLAHWCSHCRREVPVMVDWLAENGAPDGVELFGVATSNDPAQVNYPPSAWLASERWDVPTLVDAADSGGGIAFGLSSFPYFVAIDADGNVAARASGELTTAQIEQLVAAARGSG